MPDAKTAPEGFTVKPFSPGFGFPGLCWNKSSRLEAELSVLDMLCEEDVEELRKRLEASGEGFSQAVGRYVRLGMLAELPNSSPLPKA